MRRKIEIFVDNFYNGQTVKKVLFDLGASIRIIKSIKFSDDGIILNGKRVFVNERLSFGDRLILNFPEDNAETAEPIYIPINIIYEDEDILVVNKSPNLAMHETHNHQNDTLSNAVAYHLIKNGKRAVFRSCGRLDKDTDGLCVIALNKLSCAVLQHRNKIKNSYLAISHGVIEKSGIVDAPIIRPYPDNTIRAVGDGGLNAITEYEPLYTDGENTLLRVITKTGRTHQIRLHLSYIGHPLLGDELYGGTREKIKRHALCRNRIEFKQPITNKNMMFKIKPYVDFCEAFRDFDFSKI